MRKRIISLCMAIMMLFQSFGLPASALAEAFLEGTYENQETKNTSENLDTVVDNSPLSENASGESDQEKEQSNTDAGNSETNATEMHEGIVASVSENHGASGDAAALSLGTTQEQSTVLEHNETNNEQIPAAGNSEPNNGQQPVAANNETNNSQVPVAGNNELNNGQLPVAGNNEPNNGQLPVAGNNEPNNGQLPVAGNNELNNVQVPGTGSNELNNEQLPPVGNSEINNGQLPATGNIPGDNGQVPVVQGEPNNGSVPDGINSETPSTEQTSGTNSGVQEFVQPYQGMNTPILSEGQNLQGENPGHVLSDDVDFLNTNGTAVPEQGIVPNNSLQENGAQAGSPLTSLETGVPTSENPTSQALPEEGMIPDEPIEALQARIVSAPRFGIVGIPFTCTVEVSGGVGPYHILSGNRTYTTEGTVDLEMVPESAGELYVEIQIADAQGSTLSLEREIPVSDIPNENYAWKKTIAGLNLTGVWIKDLVLVAQSQVGYHESETCFIIDENSVRHGYTRYGHWLGMPYSEWCALFVEFCLEFANVPKSAFPRASGTVTWKNALQNIGLYKNNSYTPVPGDLVFLHVNLENAAKTDADQINHMGIITSVSGNGISTIQGNSGNAVRTVDYALSDPRILGYGSLSEALARTGYREEPVVDNAELLQNGLIGEAIPGEEFAIYQVNDVFMAHLADNENLSVQELPFDDTTWYVQNASTYLNTTPEYLEARFFGVTVTSPESIQLTIAGDVCPVICLYGDGTVQSVPVDENMHTFDAVTAVYAFIQSVTEKTENTVPGNTTLEGPDYLFSVDQANASISVSERAFGTEAYTACLNEVAKEETTEIKYARFFDLRVEQGISASMTLSDASTEKMTVVYFAPSRTIQTVSSRTDDSSIRFVSSGSGVYGFVALEEGKEAPNDVLLPVENVAGEDDREPALGYQQMVQSGPNYTFMGFGEHLTVAELSYGSEEYNSVRANAPADLAIQYARYFSVNTALSGELTVTLDDANGSLTVVKIGKNGTYEVLPSTMTGRTVTFELGNRYESEADEADLASTDTNAVKEEAVSFTGILGFVHEEKITREEITVKLLGNQSALLSELLPDGAFGEVSFAGLDVSQAGDEYVLRGQGDVYLRSDAHELVVHVITAGVPFVSDNGVTVLSADGVYLPEDARIHVTVEEQKKMNPAEEEDWDPLSTYHREHKVVSETYEKTYRIDSNLDREAYRISLQSDDADVQICDINGEILKAEADRGSLSFMTENLSSFTLSTGNRHTYDVFECAPGVQYTLSEIISAPGALYALDGAEGETISVQPVYLNGQITDWAITSNENAEYAMFSDAQGNVVVIRFSMFKLIDELDTLSTITTSEETPVQIAVSFAADAGIPDNTEIVVTEANAALSKAAPKLKSSKLAPKGMSALATDSVAANNLNDEYPVADVSLTTWQVGEDAPEIEVYHRTLDISLSFDGQEIEPESEVIVSVTLPDLEEGMAVTVKHHTDNGVITLDSVTDGQTVTFATDGFSLFDFTATAQEITSWTSGMLENTLLGKNASQSVDYSAIQIDENNIPEGISVLDAFATTQSGDLWLTIKRTKDLALGNLESVSLYAMENGEIAGLIKENVEISDVLRLSLGNYSDFALVRDSGLRRRVADFGNVTLNGLMPKNGVANTTDVTEEYADWAQSVQNEEDARELNVYEESDQKERAGDSRVIAAYDISIINNGEEYQPEDNPVEVSIQDEAIQAAVLAGNTLTLWHVLDDGSKKEVQDFTVSGDTVSFDASGFSVYVLTETIYAYYQAASGETYKISVEYDSTAKLPRNAALTVSEILPEDAGYESYTAQSINKLDVNEKAVALSRVFDIKIVDENGQVCEPSAPVKVSIQLMGEDLDDYASVDVLHFDDNMSIDEMDIDIVGDTVEFMTDSFSVYVVDGSVFLRTYRFFTFDEYGDYTEYAFYTDTGATTFTQTIKNGEKPVAPQNPTNPQEPNAIFAGWFVGTKDSESGEQTFENTAYDFDNIPEIKDNEEVQLYAKFSTYAYVIFHDQYDNDTETFPVAFTSRVELLEGNGTINTADYFVSYHGDENNKVFTGWSEVSIKTPGALYNDRMETIEKVDNIITVRETMDLYPIFTPVYWLGFYSGPTSSGATYYSDAYYLNGNGPTRLPGNDDINRDGDYTFKGWYASGDGNAISLDSNAEVSGGIQIANENGELNAGATATNVSVITDSESTYLKLAGDVKLYALWEARTTASYSVIIRRQKATDNENMGDDEKSYEFAERFELEGRINAGVSYATLDEAFKTLNELASYNEKHKNAQIQVESENSYFNYVYNENASKRFNDPETTTIAANGGTAIILCYDWNNWHNGAPDKLNKKYSLTFIDPQPDLQTVIKTYDEEHGGKIRYGASLVDLLPPEPKSVVSPTGYSFGGWYVDEACTRRVYFNEDEFKEATDVSNKVLYTTMPGTDLTLYAGWDKKWFVVQIDPNYGALYKYDENGNLSGTGATWFWASYGEYIGEYSTVTRDYVESDSGTWYYVNHSGNEFGQTVWNDRYTYYTQKPSEATEFTTF